MKREAPHGFLRRRLRQCTQAVRLHVNAPTNRSITHYDVDRRRHALMPSAAITRLMARTPIFAAGGLHFARHIFIADIGALYCHYHHYARTKKPLPRFIRLEPSPQFLSSPSQSREFQMAARQATPLAILPLEAQVADAVMSSFLKFLPVFQKPVIAASRCLLSQIPRRQRRLHAI